MRRGEMQHPLQRCSHTHESMVAKEMAPFHPLVRSLLGLAEEEIIKLAEDIYCGQYQMVPSILPWWYQDQLMEDLHRKLGKQMRRARLCATTGQTGPCPRAGGTPRHALSLLLGHPCQRLAGRTAPLPHCSVGAAIHEPTCPLPQTARGTESSPTLPPVMKGIMKHPVQKGWSTPTLDIDAPTNRVGYTVIEAHHQEISYLHWAQHIPEVKMSGYTTPSVAWIYSYRGWNPKGKRLNWCSWASLKHSALSDQLSNFVSGTGTEAGMVHPGG